MAIKQKNIETNELKDWDGKCAPVNSKVMPEDYTDSYNRGSLKYSPNWRNYSFHKVVIPDKTEIRECNFAQKTANTEAITGEDLVFIECNLVNVRKHKSWKLEQCNNYQKDIPDEPIE